MQVWIHRCSGIQTGLSTRSPSVLVAFNTWRVMRAQSWQWEEGGWITWGSRLDLVQLLYALPDYLCSSEDKPRSVLLTHPTEECSRVRETVEISSILSLHRFGACDKTLSRWVHAQCWLRHRWMYEGAKRLVWEVQSRKCELWWTINPFKLRLGTRVLGLSTEVLQWCSGKLKESCVCADSGLGNDGIVVSCI